MSLRQRWRAYWWSRLPATSRWALHQRNVYILPTRAGLAFVVMLLLLLLASINFQLSLGYALCFLLAGCAGAAIPMTHANLRGLQLHLRPPLPCFAGDDLPLELVVHNPGRTRHGLGIFWQPETPEEGPWPAPTWTDLGAQQQQVLHLSLPTRQRGPLVLPLLTLETRFPFGLFRAWSHWRPAEQAWVYPQPEVPAPPLPEGQAQSRPGSPAGRRSGQGEFAGVRPWQRGDSLRQVVWKKVAQHGELVSKSWQEPVDRQLALEWRQTATLRDPEKRLSRLCAWVLTADRLGLPHSLKLPGTTLPSGQGEAHRRRLLQALAEWEP